MLSRFFVVSVLVVSGLAHAQSSVDPKFERLLPNEEALRQEIIAGILHLQKAQAVESGKPALRGTHSKGVCAKAQFEILEGSKVGIFAYPGQYPATVRFANAAGNIQDDQADDVRSMSIAVEMPKSISNENGRIDFSTNDATTFPINDADVFAALMTLARKGKFAGAWEIGFKRVLAAKRAVELGADQQRPLYAAYQNMRYWSSVPFKYGPDQAIKYSFKPCQSGNLSKPLTADPNTLSLELARHLSSDETMACFDFQVQVLDEEKMTNHWGKKFSRQDWIENATWEWNEQQAPFVTIARLTLLPNSLLPAAECEAVRMNVNVNTTADHIGLGSINRGRTGAEKASSVNR